jgi:hypothetical protein
MSVHPSDEPVDYGTDLWSSDAWRAEAISWLDGRLAAAGIERVGEVEQPHLRPWATVLRVDTSKGVVWMKAAGPGTAFEIPLYELLVPIAEDRLLRPIASDPARGWIVLPHGGTPIGERLTGTAMVDALVAALVRYGELQLELASRVDDMLQLGVSDMRPAVMPQRFEQALNVTRAAAAANDADRESHRRAEAMREVFASWCHELAASQVPPSLDHNDLHPWNILGEPGHAKFYDWGDSVVAHPFAAMLVPLGFVLQHMQADLHDARFLRARDAYLDVFRAAAPDEDLASTLEIACRIAKIARVLTWDRAISAARDQGEELDENWSKAPMETLASLLDDSYIGGA